MGIRCCSTVVTIVVFLALSIPVSAHHGWDVCTPAKELSVTGKVVSFKLQNPHANLQIAVKDHKGVAVTWSFELGPPHLLQQSGWGKDTVKAGDEITIRGYACGGPAANRGSVREITISGKKLLTPTHTP